MQRISIRRAVALGAVIVVAATLIFASYFGLRLAFIRQSSVVQLIAYFDCLEDCAFVELPSFEQRIGDLIFTIDPPSCSDICEKEKPGN